LKRIKFGGKKEPVLSYLTKAEERDKGWCQNLREKRTGAEKP